MPQKLLDAGDAATRVEQLSGAGVAQAELGLDFYMSRMYDPLTAHFTTADTIIPEPGKSQSWDRYAYVRNNPIRLNDPTGHDRDCGIGDGGCKKKVTIERIEKKYSVVIDIEKSDWTMSKLQAVEKGLAAMNKAIGNSKFIKEFSGVKFYNEKQNTDYFNKMYTTGNKDVIIGHSVVSVDYIMKETAHELAHIWDKNHNNDFSRSMAKFTGSQIVQEKFLFFVLNEHYELKGTTPTEYSTENILEDWAESVTSVIFPGYATNNPWDENRQEFVVNNLGPDTRWFK